MTLKENGIEYFKNMARGYISYFRGADPFVYAFKKEMGINEAGVIKLMRHNLRQSSFKLWRKRVTGRASKHEKKLSLLKKEM